MSSTDNILELEKMLRDEMLKNDLLLARIATLREMWQARQRSWQAQFEVEMQCGSSYATTLAARIYAIHGALENLDALFPLETDATNTEDDYMDDRCRKLFFGLICAIIGHKPVRGRGPMCERCYKVRQRSIETGRTWWG